MQVRVLGSAAGGGFPQWNCNCCGCSRARAGDAAARPRTQTSLAVSADGARWVVLDATPDIRHQIDSNPVLWNREPRRDSPVKAVVVTGGDVDHVVGLLSLRERQPFALYGTGRTLELIDRNLLFQVLPRARVPRRAMPLEESIRLTTADKVDLGLRMTAFSVPGKVPLYAEDGSAPVAEDTVGLELSVEQGPVVAYVPGCARVDDALVERLSRAAVLFFDGTLWDPEELLRWDPQGRTAQQIGHVTVSGAEGTLSKLGSRATRGHRWLIHLNHTNPALLADSVERGEVERAGFRVAEDGMGFEL